MSFYLGYQFFIGFCEVHRFFMDSFYIGFLIFAVLICPFGVRILKRISEVVRFLIGSTQGKKDPSLDFFSSQNNLYIIHNWNGTDNKEIMYNRRLLPIFLRKLNRFLQALEIINRNL